jgi:hypothetical protein
MTCCLPSTAEEVGNFSAGLGLTDARVAKTPHRHEVQFILMTEFYRSFARFVVAV